MKNYKKAFFALLGATFLVLGACQQGPKKEEPTEPKQEKVLPPEGIISLEESKSLYDNYTRNRVDIIQQFEAERSPDKKHIPARFTSFTYADMKDYMAYVEQEAEEAGVKVASLRLYFANYPDKPDFPDGKKVVHPRQNSIFIVPTTMMDGEERGFYIDADGNAKPIKGVVSNSETGEKGEPNTSQASFAPSLFQGGSTSLNLNHGSSGPPPYTDF
ncbi:hypothetical protein D2V08_13450 [Flagellimonas lutimaris]|uniref:Lipoprotein n=1 Tax=Flagellimonas lutimaris TaxID=475082 RepID=A0A3A1N6N8_9FLAO|nr:hypothetical protein [Allomuricauda lutimaris]RIV31454.1 hypothetical protein D2V08_13450 [Allomuricauda lutimaris]